MGGKHHKKRSKARSIGFFFLGEFDENAMERILEKAKEAGTIFEYDTGRGNAVWFTGFAGQGMRDLVKEVKGAGVIRNG